MASFIRTKYEKRKWTPDPKKDPLEAILEIDIGDDGDDDVPLKEVQEKARLKRESSLTAASTPNQPIPPPPKFKPPVDLFDDAPAPPIRPSTTDTPGIKPPPSQAAAAPKLTKNTDSLLGLNDILGAPPAATNVRPSSAASTPSGSVLPSRKDLSSQILALYASAPKPQQPTQHQSHSSMSSMQSPSNQQQSSLGGLNNAFGDLNFQNPTSPPVPTAVNPSQPKLDPFANFSTAASQRSAAAPPKITSPAFAGQGFFESKPKLMPKPPAPSKQAQTPLSNDSSLLSEDFGSFTSTAASVSNPPQNPKTSFSNDLFDFCEPSPPAQAPPPSASIPTSAPKTNLVFNLSAPALLHQNAAKPAAPQQKESSTLSHMDAWGSSDAWATPEPPPTTNLSQTKPSGPSNGTSVTMSNDFSAWGGGPTSSTSQASAISNGFGNGSQALPKVTPDEDFGGWNSAAPVTPAASNPLPQQMKSFDDGADFGVWNSAAPATPAVSNPPPQQSKSFGNGTDFGGWSSAAPAIPAASNPPPPQSKPATGGGGFGGSDDLFSNVWG
ncbi:ARF GAP with effector function(s) [Lecanora helva]